MLQHLRCLGAIVVLLGVVCSSVGVEHGDKRPYLAAARKAASWLQAVAVERDGRKAWPADPDDPRSVCSDLYYGTAGVVLFYLEFHRATGDPTWLEEAKAGADDLILSLPDTLDQKDQPGLYLGVAGIGFVLEETHKATGDLDYREAALRCVELLRKAAKPAGAGVEWNHTTDIISGSAGTGLFLLYAADEMDCAGARDLAAQAGRHLLELGIPARGGLKWRMDPDFPRLMPNFSHGTAGVCYFLASLYAATREAAFLDGALAGARYLQSISSREGRIFHHEPGGEKLFYQGWCHGPAGTARLYYRLWRVTGDAKWKTALEAAAAEIMNSGIPEERTAGFWNNVSQCCGSAGVAEFFMSMYRLFGQKEYLEFCRRLATDLLVRAMPEQDKLKWIQAEQRVKPHLLVAQTGYLQGAAGIGACFLHLDSLERGGDAGISLPDSPF
ncbi:MAG: lanthionine synthetase LanC family protein [Planctomycetota bacterium]|jgi:lantibiotic modifying enzyme